MDIREWIKRSEALRRKAIQYRNGKNRYLLASFLGTQQQKDIEARTPLITDYFRVKINVKVFDDEERRKKSLEPFDFSDKEAVFRAMREEFDMPYWTYVALGEKFPIQACNRTFIYQLKACNISCSWCYVDDTNKSPEQNRESAFFSIEDLVDVFVEEMKKQPIHAFRPSGGEPTLAIEQWLEALEELRKRGLSDKAYVQTDTNLLGGSLICYLQEKGIVDKKLLDRIGEFPNFGILCSFKGTDEESFLKACGFATKEGVPDKRYAFLEQERWNTFKMIVQAGIDAYPFIYDPNPETLETFMDKGARLFGDGFYLKTWVVPLISYPLANERILGRGMDPEEYGKRLAENFAKSKEVMHKLVKERTGIDYQSVPRTGIRLKAINP